MASRISKLRKRPLQVWRFIKRLGRIGCRLALGFVIFSFFLVLVFRWMPLPTSGIQIQRQLEASAAEIIWEPKHRWVDWKNISATASLAVIASEDQRFLNHYGFDTEQIKKAIEASQNGKALRGASTISQQTAKNVFLWNGRSYIRKGLEAWFTVLIELLWPKHRILEVYLNSIEFGSGIFGVEAASQTFFGKSSQHINQYEAALLAAVLPNPHRMHVNRPSPYVLERRAWIVNQMRQLGGTAIIEQLSY